MYQLDSLYNRKDTEVQNRSIISTTYCYTDKKKTHTYHCKINTFILESKIRLIMAVAIWVKYGTDLSSKK